MHTESSHTILWLWEEEEEEPNGVVSSGQVKLEQSTSERSAQQSVAAKVIMLGYGWLYWPITDFVLHISSVYLESMYISIT